MSLREEIIYNKLKELKNSLYYVEEFLPSDVKYLENKKDKNALYKEAEVAIQIAIDICAVINSDISKVTPTDEDSILISLEKEKVLSNEMSKRLRSMKGFRNLLVHRYAEIDDSVAYEDIKSGLGDFDKFIVEIEKFLEKYKKETGKNSKKK